ncbi:MAG TPA: hypothetical protein VK348_14620 [Planctomycetota bacterium]|nr:hypothetical protein [Planctomycetota bacterium]
MKASNCRVLPRLLAVLAIVAAMLLVQCGTTAPDPAARARSAVAWNVVYQVLQHPRCVNCHPKGDVPLQGDLGLPHAQNVQRGSDGGGMFAMRCAACHQQQNVAGAHMPPGALGWRLPPAGMPLVFAGRSSAELYRQLTDPAQNGGRTPEQLLKHLTEDALVQWAWAPGDGRVPIPIPHATFVEEVRTWIAGGCAGPQ